MLWFVAGTIGSVELLRHLQREFPALRQRWWQALLFGTITGALIGMLRLLPGVVDATEAVLAAIFLTALAGPEGGLLGGVAVALVLPGAAGATLATAVAAAALARFRRSPLWAVPVGWLVIAVETPPRGVAPVLLDVVASGLGLVAFSLYVREVDQRRAELFRAESRATTDPLTGLLNRTGFAQHLVRVRTGALLAIDLDDFKPVNELYGHAAGDLVLQEAARRLRLALRPGDALARIGGDEFAAALADVDEEGAVAVAERMLRELDRDDVVLASARVRLRASFGVAAGELLHRLEAADEALLQAKAEGKGRIRIHGMEHSRAPEEEQLLRVTSFARDLLFGLSEGVVVVGPSRRIVAASPGYERLTGFTLGEARGRKPRAILGTDLTDPELLLDIPDALDRIGVWRGEVVNRRPAGEIWWADWSMRTVEVRGRTLGYLGIVRDVTPVHREDARLLGEAIGTLSEQHDPSIRGHLERTGRYMELLVAAYQARFGRADLPLNPEEYGIAATMHDIGKLTVDAAILAKPGPLSAGEREIVNEHPRRGYEYLRQICLRWCRGPDSEYVRMLLQAAMDIAVHHHERYDGQGYPRGLRGDEIPLAARLFSVVDVYDALRDARPYKPAWPEEDAFAYVAQRSGTMFDPTVVGVLTDLREAGEWRIREQAGLAPGAPAWP